MSGHCGITGSTYRPVERETYVTRMEMEAGSPFRGVFYAILFEAVLAIGIIAGAAMGVRL